MELYAEGVSGAEKRAEGGDRSADGAVPGGLWNGYAAAV